MFQLIKKAPTTTSEAISHIMEGIDALHAVRDGQFQLAQDKREESGLLAAEAQDAQGDAEHAARIIKRATEFMA
jgi:hypothetical protein